MIIADVMRLAPVIPVLVIDDPQDAQPVARALVAGGLRALEVTLRTPAAIEVITEMSKVEGAVVGAGTVLSERDLNASVLAGAEFIVSPGLTEPLARSAISANIPFLPGIANAGDIMRGLDLGLEHFKFFPAESNGGITALRALCGPFARVEFCPTGGITQLNAPDWLANPQVICVGGSWVVPRGKPDLNAIEGAARMAASVAR